MIWWSVARRDWRASAVIVGFAASFATWLPFAAYFPGTGSRPRTSFMFYALPCVPFMVLAIVLCLGMVLGPPNANPRRRTWGTTAVGSYVLTYSVSNGFLTTTMTRTVSVVDTTPPVITLLGGGTVTVELGGAFVDPGATALDTCAGDLTGHIEVTGRIDTGRLGSYTLTYTVSDGYNTAGGTRTVNVVDTTPPTVGSASASPGVLWPPNHRMVPVVVSVSASDLSGPVTCSIVSVGSNEPANGLGDGDTAPDWMVTGDLTLTLRAERSGRGAGRVYTITLRCRDASGNEASATASVGVPHDQGGH